MRILFLNSAKEWGGNEKWTLSAASDLASRGHTVFLGCRSELFEKNNKEKTLLFVRFPFSNVFDVFTLIMVRLFIKKNSIDILIPTKQREYVLGGLAGWKITKIAARFGIDRPLHNFRNRFAFRTLFDIVIVNSKKIIDTLSLTPGFDVNKCKLVYNGVNIPELSSDIREKYRKELGLSDAEFCIMGIGRLSSQKGFDLALQAFADLDKELQDCRLIIVGSGSESNEYRELAARLGIEKKVLFTGHRDDTSGLLQAADLFWLTSRSEGMSNALLEAMAHGKAVVAFDIAGVREAIVDEESGAIVEEGNTDKFARVSVKLLKDDKKRHALGVSSRERAEEYFSKDRSAEELENELRELVGSV